MSIMGIDNKELERAELESLSGPSVDRRTAMKVLAAAGMTGLAGCAGWDGGTDDGNENDSEAENVDSEEDASDVEQNSSQQGGRLKAGWFTGDVQTLDPAFINVGQFFQISANIFNGLVTLNEDLSFRGDLATDWEVENGGRTYTFELRDDVTFHNGDEFTAEDVRFTLRRNFEEEAPQISRLSDLEPVDDGGVEIVDDYTVRLNWQEPNAAALAHLSRGPGRAATIVNQTAYEEMGREDYGLEPVGTGPFQVREHNTGSEIILDAYNDYFEEEDGNQLPYLNGVDISLISEAGTLVNALRSGDIHMANLVPLENVNEIEGTQGVEISSTLGNTWLGLHMNCDREPFDTTEGRMAFAKAINNEALVERGMFGYAKPARGVFSEQPEWIARDDKPDDQAFDPETAQQMLEEVGAMDMEFSIMTDSEQLRVSRVIRDQLTEMGLTVEVDQVTTSTYWEDFEGGNFDMVASGSVDKPDPEESVWNFYRKPDEGGSWNWANYVSDTAHELLGEQRRATDQEERREILWELEDHLITDAATGYLAHQNDVTALSSSVEGFVHIPSFLRNFHTVRLNE